MNPDIPAQQTIIATHTYVEAVRVIFSHVTRSQSRMSTESTSITHVKPVSAAQSRIYTSYIYLDIVMCSPYSNLSARSHAYVTTFTPISSIFWDYI